MIDFFAWRPCQEVRLLFYAIMMLWASAGHSQAMDEFYKARRFAASYRLDSAYAHMQKALKESKSLSERQKAMVYIHYGKLLKLREKTDSTFFYFQKSMDIYTKYKNRDSLLYATISMAELFRFRDNKAKAGYYIKEAEKMLSNKTPPTIRAYYYNRRASIEFMYFSWEYARELSKKVIDMQDQVADKEIIVYSYNELGAIDERNNEREKSIKEYSAALALAEHYRLLIPKADVLVNLSRLAEKDQRIARLEEAYNIARQVDNKDMQFRISNLLFWPYKDKGDYKKAFEYCYIALDLQEKMYDSRALAKTAEIERKYNLSKAEQELRHKNSEVQSAEKTILLTVIVFALTLVVLFILAYFFRKTRKSNKMLEQLSQENEFLLAEANHRINNNLQLIIVLIDDELRKLPKNEHVSLNKILSKVESIATLHRHLYKAEDKRNVDAGEYLKEVLHNFSDIFSEQGIKTSFTIEKIPVPNEDVIYMGLLITELCINTLKHAFAGQEDKQICFDLVNHDGKLLFRFSDNGKEVAGKTITPKLVLRLCRQLKVEGVINTDNGYLFYFEKI